jgi:ATPase subunit of ABC transporter with duplicated ATPase domains
VQYLTSLKETTVLVVSHDADFMEKVATDIVYLNVCAGGKRARPVTLGRLGGPMNAVLRVKKQGFAFKHASFYNEELTTRLMLALCLLILIARGWLQNKQLSYYSGGFAHFRDTVGMPQSPPASPNMRRSMTSATLLSDASSLLAQPP